MIDGYAKPGTLAAAEKLMKRLSVGSGVLDFISGCVLSGMVEKALLCFCGMQEDWVSPNVITILSILRACS